MNFHFETLRCWGSHRCDGQAVRAKYLHFLIVPTNLLHALTLLKVIYLFIHSFTYVLILKMCLFVWERGWEGGGSQLKLSQDSLPSQRKEIKPQMESQGRESAD